VALQWTYNAGQVRVEGMSARVLPVKDVYGENFRPAEIMYHIQTATGKFQSNHDNGEQNGLFKCAATDSGYCAEKVDFASGAKAELAIRISNQVTGWLHGRIDNADIQISQFDDKHNRVVITGEPVALPTMYAQFDQSKMTPEFLDVFKHHWNNSGGLNSRIEWFEFASSSEYARYMIRALGKEANDTAASISNSWQIKSVPVSHSSSACLMDTKRLVGLVTTNAMAYSGAAPAWENGRLNYEVAGLHYMPDGKTPVEGIYDLAIRSDAARCLYGFSSAPISATISVTGANGELKTAVTKVFEKDGWLKLTARGFNFSSPTISVKLTQASAKKTTITCVKGKLTKKVTAVGPKCPAGYKKK
jgi:hypothetical protein